jgi:hypothetical protein
LKGQGAVLLHVVQSSYLLEMGPGGNQLAQKKAATHALMSHDNRRVLLVLGQA